MCLLQTVDVQECLRYLFICYILYIAAPLVIAFKPAVSLQIYLQRTRCLRTGFLCSHDEGTCLNE
jgi:hypothetical protein